MASIHTLSAPKPFKPVILMVFSEVSFNLIKLSLARVISKHMHFSP
ncbi:unnamed protein product [Protopolystoma xenopodis]|uniref:Uncharacterized protein n=1 Tax=Protopolystoma xenopodis TaxID=117903 RepID=A0A3S5CES4_9PLAT|nr:unnamed protein product [Protopolystoma xenopodis]